MCAETFGRAAASPRANRRGNQRDTADSFLRLDESLARPALSPAIEPDKHQALPRASAIDGAHTSFGRLKQIGAGSLNVGYTEAGATSGSIHAQAVDGQSRPFQFPAVRGAAEYR
jgi:hypothetical protein